MVPIQPELYQDFPPVYGNKDYCNLKALLDHMDEIILQSNLENTFVESFPPKAYSTSKKAILTQALYKHRTVPKYKQKCAVRKVGHACLWVAANDAL